MSREFDGSDRIVLDEGTLDSVVGGAWTIGCLFKATSIPDFMCMMSVDAGTSQRLGLWLDNTGAFFAAIGGSNHTFAGLTASTNVWYLGVVKKATGTATPRANLYSYDSDAWSGWVDSVTGTADNDGNTITAVELGDWPNGNPWNGREAVAALWTTALADGTVTDGGDGLHISAAKWIALTPGGMWRLNQASVATAVTDDTGGGADQTSITGTAVSADEPDPWSYALSSGTTASAESATGTATAQGPATAVRASGDGAAGTAIANNPTARTAIVATAEAAAGTGTAPFDPGSSISLTLVADGALVLVATAPAPSARILVPAQAASATAVANDASAGTASDGTALAEVANAVAAANGPAHEVAAAAVITSATAVVNAAALSLAAGAGAAAASATANNAEAVETGGIIVRPFTGTIARPFTGIITRT